MSQIDPKCCFACGLRPVCYPYRLMGEILGEGCIQTADKSPARGYHAIDFYITLAESCSAYGADETRSEVEPQDKIPF